MSENRFYEIKTRLINSYLDILMTTIAKDYLKKIEKYKSNDAPEIILNYLDKSFFFVEHPISITNEEITGKIRPMKPKDIKKLKKAVLHAKSYTQLVNKMRFFYSIIKNKELQDEIFVDLYNQFVKENKKAKDMKISSNQYNQNMQNFVYM